MDSETAPVSSLPASPGPTFRVLQQTADTVEILISTPLTAAWRGGCLLVAAVPGFLLSSMLFAAGIDFTLRMVPLVLLAMIAWGVVAFWRRSQSQTSVWLEPGRVVVRERRGEQETNDQILLVTDSFVTTVRGEENTIRCLKFGYVSGDTDKIWTNLATDAECLWLAATIDQFSLAPLRRARLIANGSTPEPLPAHTQLKIASESDDRLEFEFTPKKSTLPFFWGGGLWMAVLGTAIFVATSVPNIARMINMNGAQNFGGLFFLVACGMWAIWGYFCFRRTTVRAERQCVTLIHRLFGRSKEQRIHVGESPRIGLVELYTRDGVPVFQISIEEGWQQLRFGALWSDDDKRSLVKRLRHFYRTCEAEPLQLAPPPDTDFESLITDTSAINLPPDNPLQIQFQTDDAISIRVPACANRWIGYVITIGAMIGCPLMLFFLDIRIGDLRDGLNWVWLGESLAILFTILPTAASIVFGLFLWWGELWISLDQEQFSYAWRLGPLNWTWRIPRSEIRGIRCHEVAANSEANEPSSLIVETASQPFGIAMLQSRHIRQSLAALLKSKLK